MSDPQRQTALLIERCYQGLDATTLRHEVLRRLRSILTIDAAFFATVDPATLLFTSAVNEDPLLDAAGRFLDNEFGAPDVNRFADLAVRRDPVASLDMATGNRRSASRRYTDIMAPLGLGDELRVVLRSSGHSWGVMCLHRASADSGFSPRDFAVLRRIAPHVAEGLRRAQAVNERPDRPGVDGTGIVLLDDDLRLVSMNPAAEQWIAAMPDALWPAGSELPLPVHAVAARLRSVGAADDGAASPAEMTLRTESGRWVLVHASRLDGPGGGQTAVVIIPAPTQQLTSVVLAARGLTPAQERVAALVLRGLTTKEIARQTYISEHTVQEHLKAIFDKFGVRSRRELVTVVLAH